MHENDIIDHSFLSSRVSDTVLNEINPICKFFNYVVSLDLNRLNLKIHNWIWKKGTYLLQEAVIEKSPALYILCFGDVLHLVLEAP